MVKHQLFESHYSPSIFDHSLFKDISVNPTIRYIYSTINDNVKERKRNEKVKRFKPMMRVTKYHKYKFELINGKLVKDQERINLGNYKISRLINKNNRYSDKTNSLLPLPITKFCRLIGSITRYEKIKRDSIQQRIYEKDYDISEIVQKFDPISYNEVLTKNVCVYTGS